MSDFNLGTVTAYGYAKDKGYTGTEDEYAELMASYADVAEQAAESATQAAASATTATAKASEAAQSATAAASSKTAAETAQGGAETAAQTATTKAGEASASATTASGKATEATTAAGTATTKASEATTAATTATTKAGEASTSATNAAASATRAQEILDSIPEDYSQLSDDVSDLKDGLAPLQAVPSVTLYDGYIANGTGAVMPPTSDVQKCSDFIPVANGAYVKITYNLSAARYRSVAIYGYASDKTYIDRLAHVEGSALDTVTLSTTVQNQDVAYIRCSLNTYGLLVSCNIETSANGSAILTETDTKINNAIVPINDGIDLIKSLTGIAYQYIDTSLWELGYYNWNATQTALVKTTSASWYCLKVTGIPAGTYHYNKFCSLPFSFIENVEDGTISKLADIGVTETTNGSITINYDFNLWLSLNPAYFDKNTAMFASGNLPSEYVFGFYKDTAASYYVNAQGQTIWIVGEGYIPTIQAACDAASANDIIFIRCGTYTEQVSIWNKKLHLIGEDKANTILIDHSGAYNTPPLEMSLGSLSNMTIIEDGTQPTLQPGESGYNSAYCLHIEWTPPANEVFQIENCDFVNYVHSPLGCGLYQDYTVHFKDCTFRCEATNEGNMERGSFYFHSNINPNVTGQKIIAENCIISSAGQKWAVLLGVPSGANNTGSAEARFSGCTIWNDNVGTADSVAYFDTSGGADVLKVVHSCGNTVDILNNW